MKYNYLYFIVYSFVLKQNTNTQCDPVPTHTIVRDQIFYISHYTGIWIPSLNKDKGVDIHRAVLWNKECGEWC